MDSNTIKFILYFACGLTIYFWKRSVYHFNDNNEKVSNFCDILVSFCAGILTVLSIFCIPFLFTAKQGVGIAIIALLMGIAASFVLINLMKQNDKIALMELNKKLVETQNKLKEVNMIKDKNDEQKKMETILLRNEQIIIDKIKKLTSSKTIKINRSLLYADDVIIKKELSELKTIKANNRKINK